MKSKDLRRENDNLAAWREKRKELTRALVERSIDKLNEMQAKIIPKNVCEIMGKLANEEDKEHNAVITPSAISKNQELKAFIQAANAKRKQKDNKDEEYKTDGDQQFEIFKLKSIIAKQESKIKEFQSIIERANIDTDKLAYKMTTPDDHYKHILIDLVKLSMADGFLYIHPDSGDLIDESSGQIVIAKSILKTLNIEERHK